MWDPAVGVPPEELESSDRLLEGGCFSGWGCVTQGLCPAIRVAGRPGCCASATVSVGQLLHLVVFAYADHGGIGMVPGGVFEISGVAQGSA